MCCALNRKICCTACNMDVHRPTHSRIRPKHTGRHIAIFLPHEHMHHTHLIHAQTKHICTHTLTYTRTNTHGPASPHLLNKALCFYNHCRQRNVSALSPVFQPFPFSLPLFVLPLSSADSLRSSTVSSGAVGEEHFLSVCLPDRTDGSQVETTAHSQKEGGRHKEDRKRERERIKKT